MAIIPKSRLLFWTGMIIFPFTALATAVPHTTEVCLFFIGIFFFVVIADALFDTRNPKSIIVSLPDVIRVSSRREAVIEIRIQNKDKRIKRLKIGLPLPERILSPQNEETLALPKDESSSLYNWPFKALKQGLHVIEKCHLEVNSFLGFWGKRLTIPVRTEIRVYPNLFSERKNLSALFMRRQLGIHSQRQLGKGRDFEQLREYIPGDNFEDIHWKATAKRGHAITKVFQVERTQEIYIIIDMSRLSARPANSRYGVPPEEGTIRKSDEVEEPPDTIFERFVKSALMLGMAAERQADLIGLLTFADQVGGFIKAGNGKAHFDACRDMLFTLEPKIVAPDFSELFTFIGTKIRKRSLLFILTNLDDPVLSEAFVRNISAISKKHIALVNMINPAGARQIFSSPDVNSIDDLYMALGEHFIWENLRETERHLRRRGADFSIVESENISIHLVSKYFDVKQRQLL
jgi:uncharacterized protein (DUF58 family)